MRIGLSIGSAYYDGAHWEDMVELVRAADRVGVDFAWTAEAWGMETIAPLAYLAPLTKRIQLGTGIMQINARTPAMTAMTALTMARLTNDRFCLGLGVSGPQVVEGLHGVSFAKPLARMREYISVVRKGLAGERVTSDGPHYVLPRPGGEGKALRLSMPPKPDIPIYLATLGPKMLELTGEMANGWLGTSFMTDAGDQVIGHLRAGAERSGQTLADLDLQINATVEVGEDVDALIAKYRPMVVFTHGAMGSAKTNFYNAAYPERVGPTWRRRCSRFGLPATSRRQSPRSQMSLCCPHCSSEPRQWSLTGSGRLRPSGSTRFGSPRSDGVRRPRPENLERIVSVIRSATASLGP